jgi:glutathione synthase/RimK-type ligase-like ATP-grasp enzyme
MTLPERAFAVNDYHRASAAENKLVQLRAARALGFALPETLVSNDPRRIRAFLDRHAATGTICKSFRPVTWEGEQHVAILYTSKITAEQLPSDATMQLAPAIFQSYVDKAYEVRVTAMGHELFAARLDSQRSARGSVDWRLIDQQELAVEPLALPDEVACMCRSLLARLGLVFGCFDFVVTPAGDYVFLEINQMGQFLWKEQACPELPLLQAFCDFLLSRDPAFRYAPRAGAVRFADVEPAAGELIAHDRRTHVQPDRYRHIVPE